MNRVILIGRLARDPELRTTQSSISMANFTIAVSRPFSPSTGADQGADFISCVAWRNQAENLAKYCHKGSQIAIEGRIQTRNYTAQDGQKRYVTEVLADNITFLGSKSDNSGSGNTYQNNNQSYANNYQPNVSPTSSFVDNNYQTPTSMPTTDISEDPFKDFGEEIALSDDDLPF